MVPIMLCAVALLLSNLGPNTTTFVLPSESFPLLARATAHGMCSASGKLGAVVGSLVFPILLKTQGLLAPLLFLVGINLLLALFTLAFVSEMKQKPIVKAVKLQDVEIMTTPLVERFHVMQEIGEEEEEEEEKEEEKTKQERGLKHRPDESNDNSLKPRLN